MRARPGPLRSLLLAVSVLSLGCEDVARVLEASRADAGPAPDGGGLPRLDAGEGDTGTSASTDAAAGADGGLEATDGGTLADGGGPSDASACEPHRLGDPDRERVLLVGHPFGAASGRVGTEVRALSLGASGTPTDDGARLDVGVKPVRIAFVPDGTRALVLGEGGMLVSISVAGAAGLSVLDRAMLPAAAFGDLVVASDGFTGYVVGSDVAETSGVSTVHLGCDGRITVDAASFLNVRLAAALALLPGEARAVLLGGQTVFDPVDPDDLRLLERGPNGWAARGTFDVWTDFIDAGNIAVSPDGRTLLVPNGSPFSMEGGQLSIAEVAGDTIAEVARLTNLEDVRQVGFAPDGTALVTQLSPGRVVVLADLGAGLAVQQTLRGVGLADGMAIVGRGALSGRAYLPSVDANGGPNIAMLRVDRPGHALDLGQVELGSGSLNIPGPIAVTP